jgi:hypothetical protein
MIYSEMVERAEALGTFDLLVVQHFGVTEVLCRVSCDTIEEWEGFHRAAGKFLSDDSVTLSVPEIFKYTGEDFADMFEGDRSVLVTNYVEWLEERMGGEHCVE